MIAKDLKQKYLDFFVKKGHKVLPNVSLVPEDVSSSALFISAGMHPLIPYLLGEPHPLGKRLASNQRCLRTGDIEEVGDPHHLTFFEMLGNWSLGDYWKEEAISWSWEFLTRVLDLNTKNLHVSCFKGDQDAPKDEESAKIWRKLGVPKDRIHFFGKKENWWGPVEKTGPCGPDSEMFVDMGGNCRLGKANCDPSCQCGRFFEIWNDVFMQYNRRPDGKYEPLKQKNVDTGMGVERTLSVLQDKDDVFQIDKFFSIIRMIEKISGKRYEGESVRPMRMIAEHLRAAIFVIADGVVPANVEQGYVLRRLIRRVIFSGRQLGIGPGFTPQIAAAVIESYQEDYPHLESESEKIKSGLIVEEEKFQKVLSPKNMGTMIKDLDDAKTKKVDFLQTTATVAFNSLATLGIPPEFTFVEAMNRGLLENEKELNEARRLFEKAKEAHQQKSRESTTEKFTGGLADHSETVTKLHTTTHLLNQALREVLGDHVHQVGSNITPERLRFDFTHPEKLTETEIKQIEDIINKQIKADLPVKMEMMSLEEAKKKGAQAQFAEKYGEQVKVYSIGPSTRSARSGLPYSMEVCGGPHVDSTGKIGGVKIVKEKAVGVGRRRIYAKLDSV